MIRVFLKFVGYILLKWLFFYTYQFLESGVKWDQETNHEGRLLTAFMLLVLPLTEMITLIWPFQLALRQKGWMTILILVLAFAIEFILGWYATNQQLAVWMVVKIIISVALFAFMYRKQLTFFNQ